MANIVINVTGDKETMAQLRRLGMAAINLSPAMHLIGTYLTTFFSGEVFASRGRVIGEPWAPLNTGYAAHKARTFPGRPPLIRSGQMNKGFQAHTGRTFARINNPVPHFDYHQEGTSSIPARVMMKVDQQRQQTIVDIISEHLRRATV